MVSIWAWELKDANFEKELSVILVDLQYAWPPEQHGSSAYGQACGIGQGDEFLVPITYVASFQAISATGAKPVPCGVKSALTH